MTSDHTYVTMPRDGKRSRGKSDRRREKSKRGRKRLESSSSSSASDKIAPRMSLATYKAQLPAMTSEDNMMNGLCHQLGLEGGEFRDGYYVRYIEVPAENNKTPKIVHEDKIVYVDVPEIEYVVNKVEEVKVEEVVKYVPKVERVGVPREVIKHVTKIKNREVAVPVPGKRIENPIHYEVPNVVIKPNFHDTHQEVVVAQILKPTIHAEKGKSRYVEAYTIDPVLYPVDVYVPFPVQSTLKLKKMSHNVNPVDIPDAHYNTLVNKMNETVPDDYRASLFKKKKGKKGEHYIPLLPLEEPVQVVYRL